MTLVRYGEKKSYRDVQQFKKFWGVFGHWRKLHSNKILAGELIWKFGIM